MAVAIEGYSVVVLLSRIEAKFPGGRKALDQLTPNATALADDDLWRCAFMAAADANRFIAELAKHGLDEHQGPDPDVVFVNEFDQSVVPYCEWLEIAKWEQGVVAWKSGVVPKSIIAREGWSLEQGSGLQFATEDDDELEFLRTEGALSVYLNKRLNREVYISRTAANPAETFQSAAKTIQEHWLQPGMPPITGEAAASVQAAVAELDKLAAEYPDAWRIHFFIGKGRQALGDLEGAYLALRTAYQLETETEGVPREFAGACLALGKGEEAVTVGEKAAALQPDDSGTLGNLAIAYLVAGRLPQATATIQAALRIDPDDQINRHVQGIINEVGSGRRRPPQSLADLS